MKIYTKTGDSGTTGLFAGPRVPKDDPRINAYGSVDELNSWMGVAIACLPSEIADSILAGQTLRVSLQAIQSDLFSVGAELATPEPDAHQMRLLDDQRILALENLMDAAELELSPLTNFVLPGGTQSAASFHYGRTVCRRAERQVVSLMKQPGVADYGRLLVYLNRLSDFLFVLARLVNCRSQQPDIAWVPPNR